ncbi:MAG TPA: hypothetical protein VMT82_11325 [candidate division Zixibacteria bacterium]|nr:hypothetical protein [candidate division Zixibacteria bacterium]
MRTRFVIYVLVLAGLTITQISLNKTITPSRPQIQMANQPGSIMMPPSCKNPECSGVVASVSVR